MNILTCLKLSNIQAHTYLFTTHMRVSEIKCPFGKKLTSIYQSSWTRDTEKERGREREGEGQGMLQA